MFDRRGGKLMRKLMTVCWTCLMALLVILISAGKSDSSAIIRLSTNLVIVEVEVNDRYGKYVSDLTHNDFIIYEDDTEQKIDFFTRGEVSDRDGVHIRYTIGYYPTNSKRDGQLRSIRVKLRKGKNRGKEIRYYPENYFAPKD